MKVDPARPGRLLSIPPRENGEPVESYSTAKWTMRVNQTGQLPLQAKDSPQEHTAVWIDCRGSSESRSTVAGLVATVKQQASQIQKVSAQLESSKPAPQVV